jgi:hypothetical protein
MKVLQALRNAPPGYESSTGIKKCTPGSQGSTRVTILTTNTVHDLQNLSNMTTWWNWRTKYNVLILTQ